MRKSILTLSLLQGIAFGKGKNNFVTNLWNKPDTRDERVKEYVPDVLEESLAEQRAVLAERTSRDIIVELGHKILLDVENKSPTPNIAPNLNKLMLEFGAKDVIAQRPLSYLLYPNSSSLESGEQPSELIANFPDNFRSLIEEVETNGCSMRRSESKNSPAGGVEAKDTTSEKKGKERFETAADSKSGPVIMATADEHEALDVTMLVKVASAMALANAHCNDLRNAVRCVDVGIAHVVDQTRLGGLLGLKAGLLVRQKKYEEAAETAHLAVEASGNIQGYLQGAYALRMLRRPEDIVALLERGRGDHPMSTAIADQLAAAKEQVGLSLPVSSKGSNKEALPE